MNATIRAARLTATIIESAAIALVIVLLSIIASYAITFTVNAIVFILPYTVMAAIITGVCYLTWTRGASAVRTIRADMAEVAKHLRPFMTRETAAVAAYCAAAYTIAVGLMVSVMLPAIGIAVLCVLVPCGLIALEVRRTLFPTQSVTIPAVAPLAIPVYPMAIPVAELVVETQPTMHVATLAEMEELSSSTIDEPMYADDDVTFRQVFGSSDANESDKTVVMTRTVVEPVADVVLEVGVLTINTPHTIECQADTAAVETAAPVAVEPVAAVEPAAPVKVKRIKKTEDGECWMVLHGEHWTRFMTKRDAIGHAKARAQDYGTTVIGG